MTLTVADAAGKAASASIAFSHNGTLAVVPSARMTSSVAQSIQLYLGESMG